MAKKDIVLVLTFDDKGSVQVKKVTEDIQKTLEQAGRTAEGTGQGFKKMKEQVSLAGGVQSRFGDIMKKAILPMAGAVGIATTLTGAIRTVKQVVQDTIQVGLAFSRQWANVTTVFEGSEEEILAAKQALLELSPTLGSATDLARGMYEVLSAAVEPSKAIMFVGEAAKAARAGLTDTRTAVDALTTVINAYGMRAEEVTRVSDIMFMAVMRGKFTYEQLAQSLGTVVAIAAQVGVSFEELSASVATMTRGGVDAATATVQLRQILVSVLNPSKEAADEARRIGLEFTSAAIRTKGLAGFLADVMQKTKGSTESLSKLFGNVRALTGVLGLAGAQAEGFAYDLEVMKRSTGATEEAFLKQMKSIAFWVDTIKVLFEKMKIAFFEGMTDPITKSLSPVKELERNQAELIRTARELGDAVSTVVVPAFRLFIKMLSVADDIIRVNSYQAGVAMAKYGHTEPFERWKREVNKAALAAEAARRRKEALARELENIPYVLGGLNLKWEENVRAMVESSYSVDEQLKRLRHLRRELEQTKQAEAEVIEAETDWSETLKRVGVTLRSELIERLKASQDVLSRFRKELTTGELEKLNEQIRNLKIELGMLDNTFQELGIKTQAEVRRETQKVERQFQVLQEAFRSGQINATQFQLGLSNLSKTVEGLDENVRVTSRGVLILGRDFNAVVPPARDVSEILGKLGKIDIFKRDDLEYFPKGFRDAAEAASVLGVTLRRELTDQLRRAEDAYVALMERGEITLSAQVEAVGKIIKMYESLGLEVPKHYELILNQANKTAKGVRESFVASLNVLAGAFSVLADSFDGAMARLLRTAASVVDQIIGYFERIKRDRKIFDFSEMLREVGPQLAGQLGAALGEALVGAQGRRTFGGLGAAIGGVVGSIIPGIGNILGSAIGGLIGSLFKRAKTETEKEAERMVKETKFVQNVLASLGQISEQTAKRYLELKKSFGAVTAEAMALADWMKETGVTSKNFAEYGSKLNSILTHMSKGLISVEQGTKAAGEAFEAFVRGMKDLGREGDRLIVQFIQRTREMGLTIKEVDEYVYDWLETASEGLHDMVAAVSGAEDELERLGRLSLVVFESLVAQGKNVYDAYTMLQESLVAMAEKYKELGLEVPSTIAEMLQVADVIQTNKELWKAIDANKRVLEALGNTGFLTAGALTDVATQAQSYYDRLIASGLASRQALAIIAPTLADLVYYAGQYGFELDDVTRSLIEQAKEAGVYKDRVKSVVEVLQEGFDRLIERFDSLLDKIGNAFPRAVEAGFIQFEGYAWRAVGAIRRIEDTIARGDWTIPLTFDHSKMPAVIGAQRGFHGEVVGPKLFYIEPGVRERVDISRAKGESEKIVYVERPITIRPIVLPIGQAMERFLIRFVPQATADERLLIDPRGIRRVR